MLEPLATRRGLWSRADKMRKKLGVNEILKAKPGLNQLTV